MLKDRGSNNHTRQAYHQYGVGSHLLRCGLEEFVIFGVWHHYQQYFSYIVATSLVVEEAGESHRPWASNW
jgi:hypothetical protein